MFGFFLFILLTVFLIVKLNEILGMKVGFHIQKERFGYTFESKQSAETVVSEVDRKILKISKVYPKFSVVDFLNKAQKAFEIIFHAYAAGDVATLRDLLAPRIFRAFSLAIDDRNGRRETLEGVLVRFVDVEIIDSDVTNEELFITVKFVTEQSNVLKNGEGQVLEGSTDFIETRTDVWVFSHKLSEANLRWYLHEIKSES